MIWIGVCCAMLAAAGEPVDAGPLEALAKAAVGHVLSFVLEVPTTVGGVRLDLEQQVLEVTGVRVANPEGFHGETAITVDKARIEADPMALFAPEPLVRLINVTGATVNAELNPAKGINLKKLMDSAGRFKGPGLIKLPPKKWRIDKVVLDGCVADTTMQLLTKQTRCKTLDRIEMSLAGPDGKGVTTDEAVVKVLQVLIGKIGLLDGGKLGPLGPLLGSDGLILKEVFK